MRRSLQYILPDVMNTSVYAWSSQWGVKTSYGHGARETRSHMHTPDHLTRRTCPGLIIWLRASDHWCTSARRKPNTGERPRRSSLVCLYLVLNPDGLDTMQMLMHTYVHLLPSSLI